MPLNLSFVPGEASVVAVCSMISEALKLTSQIILDQTPEEKAQLAVMRINFLKMSNTFGEWILERLQTVPK
jgi:hypothetical protein